MYGGGFRPDSTWLPDRAGFPLHVAPVPPTSERPEDDVYDDEAHGDPEPPRPDQAGVFVGDVQRVVTRRTPEGRLCDLDLACERTVEFEDLTDEPDDDGATDDQQAAHGLAQLVELCLDVGAVAGHGALLGVETVHVRRKLSLIIRTDCGCSPRRPRGGRLGLHPKYTYWNNLIIKFQKLTAAKIN